MSHLDSNDELKFDVLQALLENGMSEHGYTLFENILLECGSKWTVRQGADGVYGLEERVESITTSAYDELVSQRTLVSSFLRGAWDNAFGRNPSPSKSYSDTIKAVEAATWPVVLGSNHKATLGDIIRSLEDNKGDWEISIPEKNENSGIDNIIGQLRLIWQGQTDRHGTGQTVTPSQESAEQAIFMAIEICQLFTRGLVKSKIDSVLSKVA